MKLIRFKMVCRSCFHTDGNGNVMLDHTNGEQFYHDGKLKSSFQFARIIKDYMLSIKNPCKFCGSYNLDIYSISYDNIEIERDKDLDFFAFNIDKDGSGKIKIVLDGNDLDNVSLVKDSIRLIKTNLIRLPESEFELKDKGDCTVSVTYNVSKEVYRIEVLSYMGFSRQTIFDALNSIEEEYS